MRVEVELSPVIATDEMLELAKLVDEAGADQLGISDVATRNGLSSATRLRRREG